MKRSKVYLVGAGPGKADLITVRGERILESAEVVIYDYLVDRGLLAYAPTEAELICCGKIAHKGRYSYGHPVDQKAIDQIIADKVGQGKRVVRLKNGDPAFFSRFTEELRFLIESGIEFEVVPGVTAASAASSLCGIPLTDREHTSSCSFTTGHKRGGDNTTSDFGALSAAGTLILYMGVGNLKKIVGEIISSGKAIETPVAIVQDISLVTEKVLRGTLGNIVHLAEESGLRPPAIIIVGSAAGMDDRFNWSRHNRRILFTGLSPERFFLEGTYLHIPLIKIVPLDNYDEFDAHICSIRDYDWILFTSRYGVEYFFKRLEALGFDARDLNGIKIAAIGESTGNKLAEYSIRADLIPENESSEGLIESLRAMDIKGKRFFIPRSDLSDKGLAEALTNPGGNVVAGVAYKNIRPDDLPDLDLKAFDEIMFTSPSTVRNFKERYGAIPEKVAVRCIGDVTGAEFERVFKQGRKSIDTV